MKNIETPAYIVNADILNESILGFKDALDKYFKSSILGYSLKTNSLPYILKQIKSHGGYAEVVSHDEYELARLCGFLPSEIIYNGPLKSKSSFLEAIEGDGIVNIECFREIEWLEELNRNRFYKIGIRVNIDLGLIAPNDAKDNEDYSRFGFSIESGEFESAVKKIEQLSNVQIDCLHVHRTTLSRSVEVFEEISNYVALIINDFKLDSINKIDIGGGYYGIMDNKPTFLDYCGAIFNGLNESLDVEKLTIIVEPGNALVASCIDFVTSVIDVKKIRDFYICTTDGSRNDIDPFYKKKSYFNNIYRQEEKEIVEKQIVTGGTCLEYDKIFEVSNESLLSVTDKIIYKSVGAYTMTLSPLFIRYFPAIYLLSRGEYSVIRESWKAKDFFNIYDTK
ncbi:type III PLP-dependent enzyme domain-containing protein [Myroides odoratimimus]|uniref:hypothetical protein n=1 Tax=Myroides odoratimimus TaxID=76832 RepID=UPI0025766C2E|nr:hypothetical protein [Myroides odoratimimus]MDM1514302.1 diaminopimelate decarboxylase [Myroides odoratimimus]MEC4043999.1 hypothetical protein [Myroides odoratimimus]MEC4151829.1 hypothetical protein [Myroides odoratimimus]